MSKKEEWLKNHPNWMRYARLKEIVKDSQKLRQIQNKYDIGHLSSDGFSKYLSKCENFQDVEVVIKIPEQEICSILFNIQLEKQAVSEILRNFIGEKLNQNVTINEIKESCRALVAKEKNIDSKLMKQIYFSFPDSDINRKEAESFIQRLYLPGMIPVLPIRNKFVDAKEDILYQRLAQVDQCDMIWMLLNWKEDIVCVQEVEYAINNNIEVRYGEYTR